MGVTHQAAPPNWLIWLPVSNFKSIWEHLIQSQDLEMVLRGEGGRVPDSSLISLVHCDWNAWKMKFNKIFFLFFFVHACVHMCICTQKNWGGVWERDCAVTLMQHPGKVTSYAKESKGERAKKYKEIKIKGKVEFIIQANYSKFKREIQKREIFGLLIF